jgi:hypothetical protein
LRGKFLSTILLMRSTPGDFRRFNCLMINLISRGLVSSEAKMQKCSVKVPSVLFYDEICWTKLDKIVILPYFPCNPKTKLRLEVLFNLFHPRINLATLFSTKSYLLNTIKPFSGHENRPLTKSQNPQKRGYP